MTKTDIAAGVLLSSIMGLALVGAYGWVANIIKLATMVDNTGVMVLRGIGILLMPLGSVMGFL